jgi:hypothetical protein
VAVICDRRLWRTAVTEGSYGKSGQIPVRRGRDGQQLETGCEGLPGRTAAGDVPGPHMWEGAVRDARDRQLSRTAVAAVTAVTDMRDVTDACERQPWLELRQAAVAASCLRGGNPM